MPVPKCITQVYTLPCQSDEALSIRFFPWILCNGLISSCENGYGCCMIWPYSGSASVVVVECGLTSHSAIFQLYSDGVQQVLML